MKLNYENVMREYTENYGNRFSSTCYQLFSVLCLEAWGHYSHEPRALSLAEIKSKIGSSVPTVTAAICCLEADGIIFVKRGHGKGKRNTYEISLKLFESLCKDSLYKESLCKKLCIDKVLSMGNNVDERAVSELVPASPVPTPSATASVKRLSSKPPVNKRSSEEHDAFNGIYAVFTEKRGEFEPGVKGREVKAIWQLIDKAKAVDSINWVGLLKRVITEFYRIKTSDRKEDMFLGQQPFLPSALNSPGIWPRVIENLRQTESKKPTQEDMRLMNVAMAALRG